MSESNRRWSFLEFISTFFPFQLLFAHLKYNLFALLFWAILFLIVTDNLGYAFGIPFLFLSPEYLDTVSGWSFAILGFSFGGFIMGFNTYSYMRLGPYFPFLTTLYKPFLKFCLNNAIIPLLFISVIIAQIIAFQKTQEFVSNWILFKYIIGFFGGMLVFIALSFLYFFRMGARAIVHQPEQISEPIASVMHKKVKWYERIRKSSDRRSIYIGKWLKLHQSRSSKHFDKEVVEKVFAQNLVNASIFEVITIISFLILGAFNEFKYFEVPAAASIVLLLTISLMLFSALLSWFRGWVYPLLIVTVLIMNKLSLHTDLFKYINYAYGLNYTTATRDDYTIKRLRDISNNEAAIASSKENYIACLEAWKKQTGEEKPKLVILNVSGGGSRSALWTTYVLQQADSMLEGRLSSHIQMITGASGGMVGAAYFRQLILMKKEGLIPNTSDRKYTENISKDMLNKMSFLASTNDIFLRYQKYQYKNKYYTKDRGFGFEQQLHENTEYILDRPLGYYKQHEIDGHVPIMIFSPTIINDGRRLLMSSQRLDFLTAPLNNHQQMTTANENVEYHALLEHQKTYDIRFSTVLRASATFPFVMPMVTLPTTPEIQLMDAGIRDNYGTKTTMDLLHCLNEWVQNNTSGVIIIQIRDTKKVLDNEAYNKVSFIDKITLPFGNMYMNFPRVQDFNQEELLMIASQSFDFPIDLITFNLREREEDRISLSWHLTTQEKLKVFGALRRNQNKASLEQLKRIL